MTARGPAEKVRFPAVDPEPPPRSWRWRTGATGFVLVALAALAALVWLVVSVTGGAAGKPAATGATTSGGPGGRLLFLSAAGFFGETSSNGTDVQTFESLGAHDVSGEAFAIPSDDGHYVVAGDGSVVAVTAGGLTLQHSHLDLATTAEAQQIANNYPFANGDQDLVIVTGGGPGYPAEEAPLSLVNWRTGASQSIGTGDQSAGISGDPEAPGAMVPVALPASSAGQADSRVELRDVGARPVVLATTAAVDRRLGLPSGTSLVLSPFPDRAGDKIAITANASTTQPGNGPGLGVVVVDRRGRVLASIRGGLGPESGYGPQWSPDGRSMLYVSDGSGGQGLTVWTPGSSPVTRVLSAQGGTPSTSLWSSNGRSVLLVVVDLTTREASWLTGAASGGPLTQSAGSDGYPIEWLAPAP